MALPVLYEELYPLLDANEDILADINLKGDLPQTKYFNYLVKKYFGDERHACSNFEQATLLSKSAYDYLSGRKICKTTVTKEHVVCAIFWLVPSYEEARFLFLLWFHNQMNENEFSKWDFILKDLEQGRNYFLRKEAYLRVSDVKEKIEKF